MFGARRRHHELVSILTKGQQQIMSLLDDMNAKLQTIAAGITTDNAATTSAIEGVRGELRTLRDQLAALAAAGSPPTDAELAALNATIASLGTAKSGADANVAALQALATDPAPVTPPAAPTSTP